MNIIRTLIGFSRETSTSSDDGDQYKTFDEVHFTPDHRPVKMDWP